MAQRMIPLVSVPVTGSGAQPAAPPIGEQRLPRYTSYPPATEFAALDGELYADWLGALPAAEPVSLYLHIPYCRQLCLFCGCFTRITSHYEAVREYLGLLLREIAQTRARLGRRLGAAHVHFGGGSPTILEPADFSRLMDALHESFDIQPGAEIALEIDPRTIDASKCAAYARGGVNRASLGVQDFSTRVQQAVNRIQPYELVATAVAQLRSAGIERINLDLMYGLPYQTVDSVLETARLALELEPQRLAVFGYAHVPWMRKHQRVLDEMPLPGPAERSRMAEAMRRVFIWNGYKSIGIDHYACDDDELTRALEAGSLRRNFQGYTADASGTLLAFGLSAISALPAGYAQNTSSIHDYRKQLAAGAPVVARGLATTDDDRMRRDIIGALMCYYRVDLREASRRHGRDEAFIPERTLLKTFEERGLVTTQGDVVALTPEGRPHVRAVCAVFDQYLRLSQHRYSLVV
ncbi:MAG TPA: oxygen-independent coproporphyrinogen III oxidase [Gammaproteobacteria bacterium]|nr:oxygen-independent coproporphyrinogen III oxidase [Gammaproteobacteria bacterium]